jgi:hypothetical protein
VLCGIILMPAQRHGQLGRKGKKKGKHEKRTQVHASTIPAQTFCPLLDRSMAAADNHQWIGGGALHGPPIPKPGRRRAPGSGSARARSRSRSRPVHLLCVPSATAIAVALVLCSALLYSRVVR